MGIEKANRRTGSGGKGKTKGKASLLRGASLYKKKTKKKKTERKDLVKECDALLSRWASLYLGPKCATCSRVGSQAAHYFGKKSHPSVRYNTDNILWQCTRCHIFVFHLHGDAEHARTALLDRIGGDAFEILERKAHESSKTSLVQLEATRDVLRLMIEDYGKNKHHYQDD